MTNIIKAIFIFLYPPYFIFNLIGCSPNSLPNYTQLGDLRILGIIANTPETYPGASVTFTPILSDLNGQGRTLNYSVQACMDPGVGIGATPVCTTPDPINTLSGTVTPPAGASQTYTGPVPTFTLTMPNATTAFNGRSTTDQYNGVNYLVFYQIASSNGTTTVNSFLRVTVSSPTKTQKNLNPTLSSFQINGTTPTGVFTTPTTASNFSLIGSPESYSIMQNDGNLSPSTEELITTWFLSDGTFDYSRTVANSGNSWTPPAAVPSGRGIVLLTITRDGRNGAVYQKIEMN